METRITGPHKAIDYKSAFYEAQAYFTASVEINKKLQSVMSSNYLEEDVLPLRNAEYVNHAFALEQLLKCIMIAENKEYYRGHNLFRLFAKLNSSTQTKIAFSYNRLNPIRYKSDLSECESITLESVLKEGGNSFMGLRYTFEPHYQAPRYNLDMAADLIVNYIHRIKPELKCTVA